MKSKRLSFIAALLFIVTGLIVGCSSGGGGGGNSSASNTSKNIPSAVKNLSNSSTDSFKPVIVASSAGKVYVAWEEAVTNSKKEIYLAASDDSDLTVSTIKNLTTESKSYCDRTGANQGDVRMATGEDNSLYLAWLDSWTPAIPVSNVKFFREGDASCNTVSDTYRTGSNAYTPHFQLNGSGEVHIVWSEDHGAQKDISYTHLEDNGGTFLPSGSPKNLSNTPSDSSEPLLGFDGSLNVTAVWVEGSEGGRSMAYSKSSDSGSNFSIPEVLPDAATDSYCPVMAKSEGGNTYIIYKGDTSIYFTRWMGNVTLLDYKFSDPVVISPQSSSAPSCPEIAISPDGTIYAVWEDSGQIWVAVNPDLDAGSLFTVLSISSAGGKSLTPKIAMDGNYSNIIWVDGSVGKEDIYFSGSIDNGASFSPPRNLTNSSEPSAAPSIASDKNGSIYVTWSEGETGGREIYLLKDPGARGISP